MKVYCIENKLDNKKYVGITRGEIVGRFKSHKRIAKNPNDKNHCHIHNAMFKYGLENFIVYEIDSAETKEELLEKEKHWIKKLDTKNNGYNETDGGEGCFGWKATEEQKEANRKRNIERTKDPKYREFISQRTKEAMLNLSDEIKKRMSVSATERNLGNKHSLGKTWTLSEETKKKISESKKGFKHTDEAKRKLSEKAKLRTGRKHSPETIEKMRIAAKNRIRKVGT
jgi:group I intron endonuclease